MKKALYILVAVVAIVACTKEWPWADNNQPNITRSEKDGCYELFISIDGLTDESGKPVSQSAETKAAISETDGTFSWTAGDEVDVVTSTGVFVFTAAENGARARFIYNNDDFSGTPLRVEYPSTGTTTPSGFPTEITGNTEALASANLRLTGDTFDGNSVNVHHNNALVRLEFHDVPTFANVLFFDSNVGGKDVTVTFTPLISKGTLVVYVPVDPSTTSFTAYLKDNKNNVIKSKATTTSKTFTAGTLKVMASVAVGHVIQINDSFDGASWGDREIYIWNVANTVECATFTTGYSYPYKLNSLDDNTHYIVLPSELSWITEGAALGVKFQNSGASKSTQTDCIYLYRDFTFTVPADSPYGMKTNYRVYWNNKTYTNVYAYVWSDYAIYVRCPDGWSARHINRWKDGASGGGWDNDSDGTRKVYDGGTYTEYFVYKLASDSGLRAQLDGLQIANPDNHSEYWEVPYADRNFTNQNNFYYQYYDSGHKGSKDKSEPTNDEVLTSSWHGNNITSTKNGNYYYYEFAASKYGYGYNIIFNDNDSKQTNDIHMIINKEYIITEE